MRLVRCPNLCLHPPRAYFSATPPPINECGIETFGVFHSPEDFRTVVESEVLVGPIVSTRHRKHNKRVVFRNGCSRYDPRSQDGAMDDAFDLVGPGNSTTKTIATVTTKPRTLGLNESNFASHE